MLDKRGFTMGTHHRASRGHPGVQHGLHDLTLVRALRQPDTEALPVGASVGRLVGQNKARNVSQELSVALHTRAPAADEADGDMREYNLLKQEVIREIYGRAFRARGWVDPGS